MSVGKSRPLFTHLQVEDVERSLEFFKQLGIPVDPLFSDDRIACLKPNEECFVFLLPEEGFRPFTTKEPCDPRTHTEVFTSLVVETREELDELMEKALAAGALPSTEAIEVGELKYARTFQDLDGHVWELVWMDPKVWSDTTGELSRAGYETIF